MPSFGHSGLVKVCCNFLGMLKLGSSSVVHRRECACLSHGMAGASCSTNWEDGGQRVRPRDHRTYRRRLMTSARARHWPNVGARVARSLPTKARFGSGKRMRDGRGACLLLPLALARHQAASALFIPPIRPSPAFALKLSIIMAHAGHAAAASDVRS